MITCRARRALVRSVSVRGEKIDGKKNGAEKGK